MDVKANKIKLIYLKRTGTSKKYKYWYWSKKLECLIPKPRPIDKCLIELNPKYDHHPKIIDREFQVGDIIYNFSFMEFAVLINQDELDW